MNEAAQDFQIQYQKRLVSNNENRLVRSYDHALAREEGKPLFQGLLLREIWLRRDLNAWLLLVLRRWNNSWHCWS